MEWASSEVLKILLYLLPGFISAWIFYGLTSYTRPTQFERIVQALIFTVFTQVCVLVIRGVSIFIGKHTEILFVWDENISLILSIFIAIIIGLFFARFANNNKIHSFLKKKGFTKETSYPTE